MFVDYQRAKQESVFTPEKRLDEVIETNDENKTDLIVARKIAEKSNCSYIFGEAGKFSAGIRRTNLEIIQKWLRHYFNLP